jgi:hypothetical protein
MVVENKNAVLVFFSMLALFETPAGFALFALPATGSDKVA